MLALCCEASVGSLLLSPRAGPGLSRLCVCSARVPHTLMVGCWGVFLDGSQGLSIQGLSLGPPQPASHPLATPGHLHVFWGLWAAPGRAMLKTHSLLSSYQGRIRTARPPVGAAQMRWAGGGLGDSREGAKVCRGDTLPSCFLQGSWRTLPGCCKTWRSSGGGGGAHTGVNCTLTPPWPPGMGLGTPTQAGTTGPF